jgi:hypothetical protein
MRRQQKFLHRYKYELLLAALVLHLFIGIVLSDLDFYTKIIWPINMLLLGFASVGIFIEKGKWKNIIRVFLFVLVLLLPFSVPFLKKVPQLMPLLSIIYVAFFVFIFWEVLKFLIRPGYINSDIISASACGYFLLIEIMVFGMQAIFYSNPLSFKGIDMSSPAATYMDLVYFCSITITSIGFGDILPNTHFTKLITSFFGVAGQFYTVVLVGILISKFSSNTNNN